MNKIHNLHSDQNITINTELILAIKLFRWFKFNPGLNTHYFAYLENLKRKKKSFNVSRRNQPEKWLGPQPFLVQMNVPAPQAPSQAWVRN
jgi:hypothetical protein